MTLQQMQERLKNARVGIAGCGGLGSNCAVALARVGIGKLILADFDVVEESNLNRQYYFRHQIGESKVMCLKQNIHLINPDIHVEAHQIKLTYNDIQPMYKECDVVVEAFDRADMKQMIIEAVMEQMPDMPLVIGLGMAGWSDSNSIKMRKSDNLYICGDEKSEVTAQHPPLAPRVGMVANMQANTVLEILLNNQP